jgi:hypothetical protein
MSEYLREIAKIERTHLGFEDHGILTAALFVSYGGAGQSVGGYDLREKASGFVLGVLKACNVETWEQVKGRTVYVLRDPETRRVEGIEPLPTERGERFIFAEVFGGGDVQ